MSTTGKRLLFAALLIALVGAADALNYQWLTDEELTVWGDRIKFWHGDTLEGDVRSNSQIAIMQDPVFYGRVITTASDFWHGTGYDPQFLGPPPEFNAPGIYVGGSPGHLRQCSAGQGRFFSFGPEWICRLLLDSNLVHVYRWPAGTPFDSTDHFVIPLLNGDYGLCCFFDCPIEIAGRVAGRLTIGTSHSAGILDNILYVDSDPLTGVTPQYSPNYFALAAEGSIVVLNTPENGRENSGGLGDAQTDPNLTDVVLCGAYYALGGSITFQNQNDADSGYVCACQPDDRGDLLTFGGFVQSRRGYLHRSTRTSTGYHLRLRWDHRLRYWSDFVWAAEPLPDRTDTLDYGPVVVGSTAWDTAYVYVADQYAFGGATATYPWYSPGGSPAYGDSFAVPCRFTPPHTGDFRGILSIYIAGQTFPVRLLGEGTLDVADHPALPHDITLSAYPNPFNSVTTLSYVLPAGQGGQLLISDITGRAVAEFVLAPSTGIRSLTYDAADQATGIYFAQLLANSEIRIQKLLVLK
ncbi:T9SS type A sorting domain-containing protein [candidate division KSB1 bacterium]|nr:T9SS type A sorting domain-containing protein [candidate division KSB1 bacterium]